MFISTINQSKSNMIKKMKDIFKNNIISKALLMPILNVKNNIKNRRQRLLDTFLSNIIEGNLIVKLKNISGKYVIDVRSHLLSRILMTKDYEPEIVDLILKNIDRSKDAINIGANIGLFTNFIANEIDSDSKVLAIEPTPIAFKLLETNVLLNDNTAKVITYNGIATDRQGAYQINIIPGKEEYSSLGDMAHASIKNLTSIIQDVEGETIDNLVDRYNLNPGIMVIDVEGAEDLVIQGALNTIQKFHPVIISELDDVLLKKLNSNSNKVICFLESLGYEVKDVNSDKINFPFSGNIIAKFNESFIINVIEI